MDKNLYDLDPIELSAIPQMPASLGEAIDALEKDHEFLLKGDVFTEDVISSWIEWKREEITSVNSRPHPHEFFLYYDA
jgi:glutamine synthetase